MKIKIDSIEVIEDEGYYRINVHVGTHHLHSEKLNKETAPDIFFEMIKKGDVK